MKFAFAHKMCPLAWCVIGSRVMNALHYVCCANVSMWHKCAAGEQKKKITYIEHENHVKFN